MKMYQIYVCDECGFESKDRDAVELCEAKHIGLNTLEEMHDYNALKLAVAYFKSVLSKTKNEQTEAAYNHYVDKLVMFEQKHGLV